MHCNPLTEDCCTLAQSIPLQHGLFPNWRPERCDLTLGKSEGAESGELGRSCNNPKPKYLQVSSLSFADTLSLLDLLF